MVLPELPNTRGGGPALHAMMTSANNLPASSEVYYDSERFFFDRQILELSQLLPHRGGSTPSDGLRRDIHVLSMKHNDIPCSEACKSHEAMGILPNPFNRAEVRNIFVNDRSCQLATLRYAPVIGNVSIEFTSWTASRGLRAMLTGVPVLYHIKNLSITCVRMIEEMRSFSDATDEELLRFARVFPNLQSISIMCNLGQFSARLLRYYTKVRELRFFGMIPSMDFFLFQSLRSVHLVHVQDTEAYLNKLWKVLRTVVTSEIFDAKALRQLKKCKYVKELSIRVATGADEELEKAISRMRRLCAIRLSWASPQPVNVPAVDRMLDASDSRSHPYSPKIGYVASFVMCSDVLKEIALEEVSLTNREVEAIIRNTGSRVTKLGLGVHGQCEHPCDRFERIITALLSHSVALKELWFCDWDDWRKDADSRLSQEPHMMNWQMKMNVLISRLQLKCPRLNIEYILHHVKKI